MASSSSNSNSDSHRSHSETEYRELLCEYQSLQRKFDSKVEALLAVSQELATCQSERDQYKSQSIDFADRSRALKSALLAQKRERNRKETMADEQHQNLLDLLNRINEENRALERELERSKADVEESRGDNKLLRQQLARLKLQSISAGSSCSSSTLGTTREEAVEVLAAISNTPPIVSRATSKDDSVGVGCTAAIIDEFERLKIEHNQLERDLKSMLCEKEELVIERDAFKNKAERLNKELNYILNGDDRRVVADVDQLVAENRFLKEQLQHAREENGLRKAELSKYKSCLEKRKPILKSAFSSMTVGGGPGPIVQSKSMDHEAIRSMASTSQQNGRGPAATVGPTNAAAALLAEGLYPLITPKQVRQLLQQQPQDNGGEPVDYRALASALNDALNDRNLALSHQRKANKILGTRVTELEARIHALEVSGASGRSPIKRPLTPDCHRLHPSASTSTLLDRQSSQDAQTMTEDHGTMSTSVDRLRMGVDLSEMIAIACTASSMGAVSSSNGGDQHRDGRAESSVIRSSERSRESTPTRRRSSIGQSSLKETFVVLNNGNHDVDDFPTEIVDELRARADID